MNKVYCYCHFVGVYQCVCVCVCVYVLILCLHIIDLYMSICVLHVFLEVVKRFQSPKALYKFSIIIMLYVDLLKSEFFLAYCVFGTPDASFSEELLLYSSC